MTPDASWRPGRRQFLQGAAHVGLSATGLALGAACSLPSSPAPAPKAATIGWLSLGRAPTFLDPRLEVFRRALRELGYVEGHNLAIEWRHAEGDPDRLVELAAELVRLPVDLIVAEGSPDGRAARSVTDTVPIVLVVSGDPVGTGLVSSLARPGGNVTGLTSVTRQLGAKRLQLLTEVVPGLSRVAVLWNPENLDKVGEYADMEAAAPALGVELQSLAGRRVEEIDDALEAARGTGIQALVVLVDSLVSVPSSKILAFAAAERLPAMYSHRFFVDLGGLMAYVANYNELYRRAPYYVDRILKGARPADLPVEQPMTFELVANMRTARELSITFPPEVQLQMTETTQ
jgi:putative ABC transport system substrate-binding protein